MFGRKRKQEEENVGLAGLGTGGPDPFSSLGMGGHEPFSSPDPAVQVTVQPTQTTAPIPPTQTTAPIPPTQTTAPIPPTQTTAPIPPTQGTQPTPQTPSPSAVTPDSSDPLGMVQAVQAAGPDRQPCGGARTDPQRSWTGRRTRRAD